MFDTYSTLFVVAVVLTIISLKWYNIMWSLSGAIGWLILWNYNQGNPPAGIIIGTTPHEWLMYLWIILAITTMLLYFRNRGRTPTGYTQTAKEKAGFEKEYKEAMTTPMNSEDNYRAAAHAAVMRGRARGAARRR